MKTPNEHQLQTHIDLMEHNIKLLRKLNDPATELVTRYIEQDLNTLKKNCGIPVNLTEPGLQSKIEEAYNKQENGKV